MSSKISNLTHLLKNPLQIQSLVLEDLQENLCNGNKIVDGNNVPCFMLETMSTLVGEAMQEVTNMNSNSYSKRAETSEELFRHMSQWDYVGMYSTPASTSIRMLLDKQYIIDNAKSFNDNYKKIIIPAASVFKIGNMDFGLYYPIEIRINKYTNTFLVSQDTSIINPLHTLIDNTINFQNINFNDTSFIDIEIPVYQFTRTTYKEALITGSGFNETYSLTDNFYAIVVQHFKNGVWVDIDQTMSDIVYDTYTPTVKVKVLLEQNELKVNVPQVYFTNGLIGSQLKINIYETKGAIDVNIGNIQTTDINITMSNVSETDLAYTEILNRIPTREVIPTSVRISGGSDGYTFEELRQKVINDEFSNDVAITIDKMKNLFTDDDTIVTKQLDNITARNFVAHSPIRDSSGVIVSSGNISTRIEEDMVLTHSTINQNADMSITILPATLYKLTGSVAYPISDVEKNVINQLSNEHRINLFNNTSYTFSPFHIRLATEDRFPIASVYELLNPSIDEISFISENVDISTQLTIINGIVIHPLMSTTGFVIRVGVIKSDDIKDTIEESIRIRGTIKDPNTSEAFYTDAVIHSVVDSITYYDFSLESDYDINKYHRILITSLERESGGVSSGSYLDLEFPLEVELAVKNKVIPSITTGDQEDFVTTIKQNLSINLGRLISDKIDTSVNINYSDLVYQKYPETIYKTYPNDVYKTLPNGALDFTIENGEIITTIEHQAGDFILNQSGLQIVEHNAGDLMLDIYGNKIISDNRNIVYMLDMVHVDNRLLHTYLTDMDLIGMEISEQIDYYLTEIDRVQKELLEKTYMYFEPIKTIGTGTYVTKNNTTINQPLNISMYFILYVETKTLEDTSVTDNLRTSITEIVSNNIESGTIALALIQDEIMTTHGDQILSIDNRGINGDSSLQTLVNIDSNTKSILSRNLIFNTDNTVQFVEDLELEFTTFTK